MHSQSLNQDNQNINRLTNYMTMKWESQESRVVGLVVERFEFFQAANSQLLDFSYHTKVVLEGHNKSSPWFLCFSVFEIDESPVLHSFPGQPHDYLTI